MLFHFSEMVSAMENTTEQSTPWSMNTTMNSTTEPNLTTITTTPNTGEILEYHNIFNVYFMWPLVIIGTVTNIIIIIAMRHKVFRSLPISVYFSVLAVADSVVLITSGFNQSLKQTHGIRLFGLSKVCGIVSFLINFGTGASSWIILGLAVERVLAVGFPIKAKILASKVKSLIVTAIILGCVLIVNSTNLWMVDYSAPRCFYLEEFEHFYRVGKGTLTLVLFSLIPFGTITVCYGVLVWLVTRKNKLKMQLGGNEHVSAAEKKSDRLTAMSLYICLAFLLLTGPSHIYILIARKNGWVFKPPEAARAAETFVIFLRQLNYSTNFFIYLISNKQFRNVALAMFTRRKATVFPASDAAATVSTM